MKKTMIVLIGVMMLCSCQQDELFKERRDLGRTPETGSGRMGISRSSHKITPQEAAIVACLERFGPACTKGEVEEEVSEVIPICGDVGDTLMYVVQYTEAGGYMVVSATKNYYPILVEVEQGEYNSELIAQTGASLYYDSYKEAIQASEGQSEDSVVQMRMQWLPYLERSVPASVGTKSTNDELLDLVESSIAEWEAEGYNYYFLSEGKPEFMPQEVYDQWIELAQDLGNENYDYLANSVILERNVQPMVEVGPLLETEWGQIPIHLPGHSALFAYMLGCGPVAVGQIMAYYRFPAYYNWDVIHRKDSFHDSTGVFLRNLALEMCDINSFGPEYSVSNINEMREYLISKQYALSLENHNVGNVYSSLESMRPVLMTGRALKQILGHAWVCDGYARKPVTLRFELKVLSYFDPMTYETVDTYLGPNDNPGTRFHMNWGWHGSGNGFYLDAGHQYISSRQNLLNIRPIQSIAGLQ